MNIATATIGSTIVGSNIDDYSDPDGKKQIQKYTNEGKLPPDLKKGQNRFLVNSWNQIKNLLANAGLPSNVIDFAAAQVLFETANLKSHISKADYNLSGIKWINKPYQKATKGSAAPEGGNYAHYASYNAWATDFKRVLSIGGNNSPLNATSIEDYVSRLVANHYFTSSPAAYLAGLKKILSAMNALSNQQQGEHTKAIIDQATGGNPFRAWWDNRSTLEKTGVGVLAVLVGLKLLK